VKRVVCIALVLAAASLLGAAARRDNHLSSYRIRFAAVVAMIDVNGKTVPLLLDQDGIWQQHDVAFLSFEGSHGSCASGSPQEHEFLMGDASYAKYVGIRFVVGLPKSLDHADATVASSPLNLSDTFWSWQDGYKFFRLDARVEVENRRTTAFVFHFGSAECSRSGDVSRCTRPNDDVGRRLFAGVSFAWPFRHRSRWFFA
jgi:uncharacterized repeat protein (TIGR04052 family)